MNRLSSFKDEDFVCFFLVLNIRELGKFSAFENSSTIWKKIRWKKFEFLSGKRDESKTLKNLPLCWSRPKIRISINDPLINFVESHSAWRTAQNGLSNQSDVAERRFWMILKFSGLRARFLFDFMFDRRVRHGDRFDDRISSRKNRFRKNVTADLHILKPFDRR